MRLELFKFIGFGSIMVTHTRIKAMGSMARFGDFLVLAFIAGCATPVYQTAYRYEPPADIQGRTCVQGCEEKKAACQTDCQTRYQACQKDIAPLVEERYLQALKNYEVDLKRYATVLRHYEIQLYNSWPYDPWPYYPGYYYPYPRPYISPPYPVPTMPTRDGVTAALEKEKCQADCGCLPAYDSCFVGCGGKRIPETVCIKNCPRTGSEPAKPQ
jgi:hypothetical protein